MTASTTFFRLTSGQPWGQFHIPPNRSLQLHGIVQRNPIRVNFRCFQMVPTELPKTASDLLKANPKAIVHLRAQLDRKRLGLIFGSGASKDLNFPDWQPIVGNLAKHRHVKGQGLVRKFFSRPKNTSSRPHATKSLSSITQLLYGLY